MYDSDLIQLQSFELEHRRIERRMTAQNDPLGRQSSYLGHQLRYEDETTSRKGKRTTLDNQLRHEDEENDVYVTILPGERDTLASRGQLMYK